MDWNGRRKTFFSVRDRSDLVRWTLHHLPAGVGSESITEADIEGIYVTGLDL